jgi:NADPH:quinone reductase-like Zn-dependent oxidoreductase
MTRALPDDALQVTVCGSSVNPVDLFAASSRRGAQVLGTDFAGTVEAVGRKVTDFRAGDEVFGGGKGALAPSMIVAAGGAVALKPAGVSFEQAGTVGVAGTTALQALRDHGRVQPGARVLINGASGGVGTFAVQIAKALGAEVTGVCSTRNVELVRSLGADVVIDYTKEDFTRATQRYDVLVDIAGTHSLAECRRVMTTAARFVGVGVAGVQHGEGGGRRAASHFLGTQLQALAGRQKVVPIFIAKMNGADMRFLAGLMESRQLVPAIDRSFELGQLESAFEYLREGHARAKVAIRIRAPAGPPT